MSDSINPLEELLDRYRVGLLEHHAEIAQALWAGDLERAARVAHMLKGTAGSYGLGAIAEQARRCEVGFFTAVDQAELRERFIDLMTLLVDEVPPPSIHARR